LSAVISYLANTGTLLVNSANDTVLTRYFFPIVEETAKSLIIIFLIYTKKIGFHTDAAIYGFSVGSGFALIENIFYFYKIQFIKQHCF